MTLQISVVIPVHNRPESVARAIESVNRQTLKPLEVIVVDDASSDATATRVAREFPAVRLIKNPVNSGVSVSRNRGVAAARGDWIAFLDSDDEWLPDKLSHQSRAITRRRGTRICHTDEIWFRRGVRVNPKNKHRKRGGYIFEHCLPLCVISPSTVMIERDFFHEHDGFDESLPACEDYDLWLRMCVVTEVEFVSEALVIKQGGHDDQLSRRYWGMDRFRIVALQKLLDSDHLTTAMREAVIRTFLQKVSILEQGAIKRRNYLWADQLRSMADRYTQPKSLSMSDVSM
ncbi:MAG: glycosyl transferase [marine bacterium B5-7]|nr:MAG: glycosyl transferase [marine bacterium B5-7]